MAYDRDIRDDSTTNPPGTNNPGTNPQEEQILPGTPIFDAAGERIGTVADAGFAGGSLRISQSGLFARDLAIPMTA
ncbi:MAG: PRC-barrel domain-containing protein, partial [Ktedonobacterales bacterium]